MDRPCPTWTAICIKPRFREDFRPFDAFPSPIFPRKYPGFGPGIFLAYRLPPEDHGTETILSSTRILPAVLPGPFIVPALASPGFKNK